MVTDDEMLKNFDSTCEEKEPTLLFPSSTEEPSYSVTRRRFMRKNVIISAFTVDGTFHDPFEVRAFPFDVQDFVIKIELGKDSNGIKKQLVPMFIDDPEKPRNIKVAKALKNPEWDIMPPYMAFSDAKDASLTLVIKRQPAYYLMNVVFPLFVISSLAFTAYFIDADSFADRFSVLGTILLTVVATKFTYADSVPKVSYATLLDSYVFFVFAFIFIYTVVVGCVGKFISEENMDYFDYIYHVALLGLYFVGHVIFSILCMLTEKKEISKIKRLDESDDA